MQKISVIDLGSNSVKLVNFIVNPDNSYQAYQHESITVRLGEGLAETGNLKDEPIRRTIKALKLFCEIIETQSIKHVLAVATSAVREAANKKEFLGRIYFETGLRFRVLGEEEEALYSYIGAIRSLYLPSALFFDIGGGSLELVCADRFRIKKIISLPLGTLRLMQSYADNGEVSEKNLARMKEYIWRSIPNRKELDLDQDSVLVGVGGTLRALAKFHQEVTDYPLTKVHNYRLSSKSIHAFSSRFALLKPEKIAKNSSISSNRAETIAAGSIVIDLLMEKLGFDKVIVSAQGLREGTLSMSLEHPREFALGNIRQEHIQNSIQYSSEIHIIPQYLEDVMRFMITHNYINERERLILTESLRHVSSSEGLQNIMNFLHVGMDVDSKLDHHDQLVSVLSIIYSKKKIKLEKIFAKYHSLLLQSDKRSIKKISAFIALAAILSKTDVKIKTKSIDTKTIRMKVLPMKNSFPGALLEDAIMKVSDAIDMKIEYIAQDTKHPTQSIEIQ